ncbi:MAG: hypothetical protein FWC40_05150 [Proteobacteria bacterium]|nr:hypothetical protein [Pseudomonadota bacterium]
MSGSLTEEAVGLSPSHCNECHNGATELTNLRPQALFYSTIPYLDSLKLILLQSTDRKYADLFILGDRSLLGRQILEPDWTTFRQGWVGLARFV